MSLPVSLRNEGSLQHAVVVSLSGTTSNRSAIGARVTLEAGGLRQMDEVRSGGSFYSHNDLALHFGVGGATTLDRLDVRWPNGKIQSWRDLPVNHRLIDYRGFAGNSEASSAKVKIRCQVLGARCRGPRIGGRVSVGGHGFTFVELGRPASAGLIVAP